MLFAAQNSWFFVIFNIIIASPSGLLRHEYELYNDDMIDVIVQQHNYFFERCKPSHFGVAYICAVLLWSFWFFRFQLGSIFF